MNLDQYFLSPEANEADLSAWEPLAPAGVTPFATNLFGDAFFLDPAGAVHMLSRAGASCEQVSPSIDEFRQRLAEDEDGWQLRPLADRCAAAGKVLGEGQCYAFVTPPFLGGEYDVENVRVGSWREWFALTADLYNQIKDLPDGAQVRLNVGSEPAANAQDSGGGFFRRLFS
jgi:hypothetical protein